jgi:hypothetical protein
MHLIPGPPPVRRRSETWTAQPPGKITWREIGSDDSEVGTPQIFDNADLINTTPEGRSAAQYSGTPRDDRTAPPLRNTSCAARPARRKSGDDPHPLDLADRLRRRSAASRRHPRAAAHRAAGCAGRVGCRIRDRTRRRHRERRTGHPRRAGERFGDPRPAIVAELVLRGGHLGGQCSTAGAPGSARRSVPAPRDAVLAPVDLPHGRPAGPCR